MKKFNFSVSKALEVADAADVVDTLRVDGSGSVLEVSGSKHKDKLLPITSNKLPMPANSLIEGTSAITATSARLKNKKPFIDYGDGEPGQGCLVIPFGCDEKYHYWNGGQSIWETLKELNAPTFIVRKYLDRITTPTAYAEWKLIQSEEESVIKGEEVVYQ